MSNEIKERIKNNLVVPTADNRSTANLLGIVIDSNERANLCDIRYTDKQGKIVTRRDVPVFMYNIAVIDWFPDKGDKILVQEKDNNVYVVGPAYGSNYSNFLKDTLLKQDIFTDSYTDFLGGFIF